jgi:hypothetical protein
MRMAREKGMFNQAGKRFMFVPGFKSPTSYFSRPENAVFNEAGCCDVSQSIIPARSWKASNYAPSR